MVNRPTDDGPLREAVQNQPFRLNTLVLKEYRMTIPETGHMHKPAHWLQPPTFRAKDKPHNLLSKQLGHEGSQSE